MQTNKNHIYAYSGTPKTESNNLKLILNMKEQIKHLKIQNKVLKLKANDDID